MRGKIILTCQYPGLYLGYDCKGCKIKRKKCPYLLQFNKNRRSK